MILAPGSFDRRAVEWRHPISVAEATIFRTGRVKNLSRESLVVFGMRFGV